MEKVLVLSVNAYNFTDKATGQSVTGLNVEYIIPETLTMSGNKIGYDVMKVKGNISIANQLPNAPGFYELGFIQKPDSKGRPVLQLCAAKYLGEMKLSMK